MGLMQLTRLVQVDCPLGPDVLLLQRMEGREELGRLFAYELHLVSENPNLPLEQLLGKPMSLSLELPGGSRRFFHGIVARCSQVAGHGQFAGYQATLRPWPWLLTRTSDCRIFQNQSVPEIIKQVFRDLGFSDFEDALTRPYREWEYCVQYRETSFDFISRLMEQEGIYYCSAMSRSATSWCSPTPTARIAARVATPACRTTRRPSAIASATTSSTGRWHARSSPVR